MRAWWNPFVNLIRLEADGLGTYWNLLPKYSMASAFFCSKLGFFGSLSRLACSWARFSASARCLLVSGVSYSCALTMGLKSAVQAARRVIVVNNFAVSCGGRWPIETMCTLTFAATGARLRCAAKVRCSTRVRVGRGVRLRCCDSGTNALHRIL